MRENRITTRISLKAGNVARSLIEQLAVNVLGAKKLLNDPDVTVFRIPDGTVLEVYGTGYFHPQKVLGDDNAFIKFRVGNIEDSMNLMLSAGAKSTEGIIRTCKAFAYCHLLLGDGHIVGLYQEN